MSIRAVGGGGAVAAAVIVPPELSELSLTAIAAFTCIALLVFLAVGELARRAEERGVGDGDLISPEQDREALLERVAALEEHGT